MSVYFLSSVCPFPRRQRLSRRIETTRIAVSLIAIVALAGTTRADWRAEIGYTRLQQRLGGRLPTGSTVTISQVEMAVNSSRDYMPDVSDPQFAGKAISRLSGVSGVSNHATTVAQYYCGVASSVTPGVRQIASYDANDWAEGGFLNINSSLEPLHEVRTVQNHSWIGSFGVDSVDLDVLRRIDYVVQRDGAVVTAGVKNGTGTAMPKLMCSAYNIIAVGLTSGESSFGPTRLDGERIKPDLVAPLSATSWATPVVAACASILIEGIEDGRHLAGVRAAERPAARAMLAKALLMGGATKQAWTDWHRGFETPCTDGTVPLDYRYGAGQLDVDNSYRILVAGEHEPGEDDVPVTGWDYGRAEASAPQRYYFEIPENRRGSSASFLLTWHRRMTITDGDPLRLNPSMANLTLRLCRANGFTTGAPIDASVSPVDNVEHVYLRSLPAGRYVIEVTGDRAWDYCLTWDIATEFAPSPTLLAARGEGDAAQPGAVAVIRRASAKGDGNPVEVPQVVPVAGE